MNLISELINYDGFSNSEKAAADYIAKNIDECLRLSVDKIGELSFTSGPTVSRVIKKLGYSSFSDFKIDLARCQEAQTWVTDFSVPFNSNDDEKTIINKMKKLQIESIERVIENVGTDVLIKVAKMISEAREVTLFGKGPSFFICEDFGEKLRRIGIKAISITSQNDIWTQSYTQNERDMTILISFYGRSASYIGLCNWLKKKGVKAVTVTGVEGNPLSKVGDVNICLNSKEKYDKIAAFESRTEMQFVLDILYCYLFRLNYDYNLIKVKENIDSIKEFRGKNF